MACYHPVTGYWLMAQKTAKGARVIVFSEPRNGEVYSVLQVPCGQCIGCRLERSRQWAIRCLHESQMHKDNCFITLTYDPKKLPSHYDGSLHKRDFQLFMKKLRREYALRIRYFHCGEYGENFSRPHFHACLFGLDFPDKKIWKQTEVGNLYTSKVLNDIWGYGYCIIGDVTFDSAAYVARYITKKITGKEADNYYVDKSTGLLRSPEYITMSRRPGIGYNWYIKFKDDLYPTDQCIMNGRVVRPARYYDKLFDLDSPKDFLKIKKNRVDNARRFVGNNTIERLATRETIAIAKLKTFKKRSYENG